VSFFSPSIRPLSSHTLALAPSFPPPTPPGGERPGSAASLASVRRGRSNRYHYEAARMHVVWNTHTHTPTLHRHLTCLQIQASQRALPAKTTPRQQGRKPAQLAPAHQTTHTLFQVVAETVCGERNPDIHFCLLVPCGSGMQRCNFVDGVLSSKGSIMSRRSIHCDGPLLAWPFLEGGLRSGNLSQAGVLRRRCEMWLRRWMEGQGCDGIVKIMTNT
jgi:hypothetical protein